MEVLYGQPILFNLYLWHVYRSYGKAYDYSIV